MHTYWVFDEQPSQNVTISYSASSGSSDISLIKLNIPDSLSIVSLIDGSDS